MKYYQSLNIFNSELYDLDDFVNICPIDSPVCNPSDLDKTESDPMAIIDQQTLSVISYM